MNPGKSGTNTVTKTGSPPFRGKPHGRPVEKREELMKGAGLRSKRESFGTVTVEKMEDLRLRSTGAAINGALPRLKYTWLPPEEVRDQLPPEFALSLQCVTGADGLRRFYPWN